MNAFYPSDTKVLLFAAFNVKKHLNFLVFIAFCEFILIIRKVFSIINNRIFGYCFFNYSTGMLKHIPLLLFVYSIFLPLPGVSQNNQSFESKLECIEKKYFGSDELLVNGRPYFPINLEAKGHPFYLSDEYQSGILYVKDRVFDNVDLRYNVEKDQLLLRQELNNSAIVEISFTSSLVDSFYLHAMFFINDKHVGINKGATYLKRLFKGRYSLYEKRKKVFYSIYTEIAPFGRYSDAQKTYFIQNIGGSFTEIKNKRAFLKFFGKHKKSLRRFMKKHSIRFGKATDEEFYILMKYCNELEP